LTGALPIRVFLLIPLRPSLPPSFVSTIQVVVTPGFNVQEYINIEKVRRPGVPMVVVNGNLDRIRGGEGWREGRAIEGEEENRRFLMLVLFVSLIYRCFTHQYLPTQPSIFSLLPCL